MRQKQKTVRVERRKYDIPEEEKRELLHKDSIYLEEYRPRIHTTEYKVLKV